MGRMHAEVGEHRPARVAGDFTGDRVPRRFRGCAHQHDQRRGSGDRAQARHRRIPTGARQEREGVTQSDASLGIAPDLSSSPRLILVTEPGPKFGVATMYQIGSRPAPG